MPTLNRSALLSFLRSHPLAVVSSAAANGSPQSAAVGIAISDELDIVFDTLASSRKAQNAARDARVAIVIGGMRDGDEQTVQIEGVADRPEGEELRALQAVYYKAFPDGPQRLSWPGLIYVRIRPRWLRYSDFRKDPPTIVELDAMQLARMR
jgi:pyridoxine/pyridoxamine 5'-phosphate oxidase